MTQFWFLQSTKAITVPHHHMIRDLLQYHKSSGMKADLLYL